MARRKRAAGSWAARVHAVGRRESAMGSAGEATASTRGEPGPTVDRLRVAEAGVEPRAFVSSAWNRWTSVGARMCVAALAGAAVLAWGTRHGSEGVLVAVAFLIGPAGWLVARPGWRAAWRIVVSEGFVEGTRYGGARIRLGWDGIGEVQHFLRAGTRGPIRVLRLLSIDRQREVIFDDRLPGFERLMGLVETGVRHVGGGTPSSWGRFWPDSPVRRGVPARETASPTRAHPLTARPD